ncbi:hypothetical protein U1Q18_011235 [Sarracenia purpurea var. burkii]
MKRRTKNRSEKLRTKIVSRLWFSENENRTVVERDGDSCSEIATTVEGRRRRTRGDSGGGGGGGGRRTDRRRSAVGERRR